MIHRGDTQPPCRIEYVDNVPTIVLYERQPIGDHRRLEIGFSRDVVRLTTRPAEAD
jgi:hypothetical protein